MWPFDFFHSKKKRLKPRRKSAQSKSQTHQIHARIEKLEAEKKTMHLLLHEHHHTLAEHTRWLEKHAKTLDELVDLPAFSRPKESEPEQESKEAIEFVPKITTKRPTVLPKPDKLQVNSLSRQEQKILTVFFQHPDMALSYMDIGTFLKKSSNTIKNQMRQLGMKADLFSKTTDNENRNRFQLKDDLRIEKYLNLGKPAAD
jgi:hypothetical protein